MLYGCTNMKTEKPPDKKTITVAVPAADKEVIGKYINEYKSQSDVDFKIIGVAGDSEDIHRFYVSTCMDDKFSADAYLMDDRWISEFAKCGYIEETDLSDYEFIPSVKEAVMFEEKTYAVPVYSDAYAEFTKRSNNAGKLMYIEDNTEDYFSAVQYINKKTADTEAAINQYENSYRSNNTDEFLFGEWSKARGWLGKYDIMKEHNVVKASDVSIDISENALLKTKVFAIKKGTPHKEEIKQFIKFFLSDFNQRRFMEEKTVIPVLKSFYEREDLYDIAPYIIQVRGMKFTRLKADEHYTADIKALGTVIGQNEDVSKKLEIISRLTD